MLQGSNFCVWAIALLFALLSRITESRIVWTCKRSMAALWRLNRIRRVLLVKEWGTRCLFQSEILWNKVRKATKVFASYFCPELSWKQEGLLVLLWRLAEVVITFSLEITILWGHCYLEFIRQFMISWTVLSKWLQPSGGYHIITHPVVTVAPACHWDHPVSFLESSSYRLLNDCFVGKLKRMSRQSAVDCPLIVAWWNRSSTLASKKEGTCVGYSVCWYAIRGLFSNF